MEDPAELRNEIVKFASTYLSGHQNEIPSVRMITEKLRITNNQFYAAFQGGIAELSKACNAPITPERLEKTSMASKARAFRKDGSDLDIVGGSVRIMLTEEQTRRILGMSHLEGGKDSLLIIDDLLNTDSQRRKESDLSLSDLSKVLSFVKSAESKGMHERELLELLQYLYYNRIDQLRPETLQGLISLASELVRRKWNIPEFVAEATNSRNIVNLYARYRRGEIPPRDALHSLRSLNG